MARGPVPTTAEFDQVAVSAAMFQSLFSGVDATIKTAHLTAATDYAVSKILARGGGGGSILEWDASLSRAVCVLAARSLLAFRGSQRIDGQDSEIIKMAEDMDRWLSRISNHEDGFVLPYYVTETPSKHGTFPIGASDTKSTSPWGF